jgi:MSHA biogenesis protein MshI
MFNLFGKKQSNLLTGIVSGEGGTAVASIKQHGKGQPELLSCDFSASSDSTPGSLGGLLGSAQYKSPCSALLPVGEYQLLVVDAPEVPPEEMAAAIRWRIQEMIDFHIDDAVLDIFDAPPAGPANSKQVYVVVARTDTIRQRIDGLEQAGINLEIIDIPELAMRNIAACLPEDEAGLVSLYFGEDHCLITITHNATLYLTRSIDIGYRELQEQAASPQALCNRLALEIQRSMDYYEHNYHQAAIKAVALLPVPVTLFGLADALQQTLGVSTRMVNVDDIVDCDATPDDTHAADCLLAVGSALRTEAVAL